MKTSKEVLYFCKRFGISVEQFYGNRVIYRNLDLSNKGIKSLPEGFNPILSGSLYLDYNLLTELPKDFSPNVGGDLRLDNNKLVSLPEGFKPIVRYNLWLNNNCLTELPKDFNPTVGSSLDLGKNQLEKLPDGFNPTVGGSLYFHKNCLTELPKDFNPILAGGLYLNKNLLTELPKDFNPILGCSLDLNHNLLTELPKDFNPIVGDSLDLSHNLLTELPKDFNPTVGGDLELYYNNLTKIPKYFNPIVGGEVYVDNHLKKQVKYSKLHKNYLFSWMGGKYIKVDGIFCEVLEHRGLVWKCKNINKSNIFYIVTDGNGKYAHGDTIKEAKADLIYKISNRDKSSYENLTLDSVLSFEDAIECYRVITGACTFGTKVFCKNKLVELKDTYTISEMISLTEGQYGNKVFKEFFKY